MNNGKKAIMWRGLLRAKKEAEGERELLCREKASGHGG